MYNVCIFILNYSKTICNLNMIMALTSFNDWQNLNDIKPLKLTNHTHKIYNTIKIFSKDDLGHQLTLEIKFLAARAGHRALHLSLLLKQFSSPSHRDQHLLFISNIFKYNSACKLQIATVGTCTWMLKIHIYTLWTHQNIFEACLSCPVRKSFPKQLNNLWDLNKGTAPMVV